ncbi:uncharacterized protein LOC133186331 [Saccostrea echinata]|uniref:uncharacterized protein LOC133186331 n=1 Tax=Saccostrea echinata TaxID=191078 RepID=UPI002A833C99|nr:uncharacterized protein LOC133186331 [Saccostrea echinata]
MLWIMAGGKSGVVTRCQAEQDFYLNPPIPWKRARVSSPARFKKRSHILYPFYVTFEYGAAELNLYKRISSELQYIWRKEFEALKAVPEPKDGIYFITDDRENVKKLCLEFFQFSTKTTHCKQCEEQSIDKESVFVCYLGDSFWEDKISFDSLNSLVKDIDRSLLFFIVDSHFDIEKKVKLVVRKAQCHASHVLRVNAEKSIIYEKCYFKLEKTIDNSLSLLKAKPTTRQVSGFVKQLEELKEKLFARKFRVRSKLTKECVKKIRAGRKYGVVGYRLCDGTLHIFYSNQNPNLRNKLQKAIETHFQGEIEFQLLKEALNPQCVIKCGGEIVNEEKKIQGSLGMFGEISSTQNLDDTLSNVVAITSGHLFKEGDIAKVQHLQVLKTIGRCIWPNENVYEMGRSVDNVHDVSIISVHKSVLGLLLKTIEGLNESIHVYEQPLSTLTDRMVFKYGATTSKTEGFVQKVSDFELFGGEVMVILPHIAFEQFSDKGDSGSIILTRVGDNLYAVGIIYGGELMLLNAECFSAKKETIAASLRVALDRFNKATTKSITFDKI